MKSRRKSPGDTGTKYNRTQSQYNAFDQVKTSIDALNRNTTSTFDNLGRLKQTTAPAISGQANLTTYTYDLAGNMKSLTDSVGETTTWTHDYRNRIVNESVVVDSLTLTRQYQYWNNDNLKWVKNRDGKWTRSWQEFAYGAPGNYQTVGEDWWTTGTSYDGYITYAYDDAVNNGLTVTDITRLV